jgi:hypothetical protein
MFGKSAKCLPSLTKKPCLSARLISNQQGRLTGEHGKFTTGCSALPVFPQFASALNEIKAIAFTTRAEAFVPMTKRHLTVSDQRKASRLFTEEADQV